MADRFPLILNTSANQIQEIASGDQLDLSGNNIANAGIITAGNVTVGAATTDLIVNGDARVTGILTVGTGSLTLNGLSNLVNVGTALTLGHTQGLQFHTQNLHSAGFEVNQINVSGVATATTFKGNGDFVELDVDGHTNLDNVSIAGVVTATTFVGALTGNPTGTLQTAAQPNITSVGTLSSLNVSGSVSIGGTLTYEDVTNIDSVGIITARNGITVSAGTATFQGAIDANGDLDVDGHTNLDNVSIAGVVTATTYHGDGSSLTGVSMSASEILTSIKTVDGSGSGLDADTLDGLSSTSFPRADTTTQLTGQTTLYNNLLRFSGTSNDRTLIHFIKSNEVKWRLLQNSSGESLNFHRMNGSGEFRVQGYRVLTTNDISNNADNRIITGGSGTLNGESELTYSTYLNLTRSNSDTNFGDNSSPGGVNGIFISNSQSTNGVFSAISLSANDTNGTNQSGSLVAKSVSGGYTPEVHISQRTGNNLNESNIKLTSSRAVELRYQGSKKLETTSSGATVTGSLTATDHLYVGHGDYIYFTSTAGYSPRIGNADGGTGQNMYFYTNNTARVVLEVGGALRPASNNAYDLGTSSDRWRNIYTNDLNLSNEGSSNDVDGTWGNYTIQEGESDLFLINKRSGKKYKFNLTEVS